MQAALAISGAFCTTNSQKLLNPLGLLEINREARCQFECCTKGFDENKQIRIQHLEEQEEAAGRYFPPFDKKLMNQVRRRESI